MSKFLANKNVGKRFAEGTEANRWLGGKLLTNILGWVVLIRTLQSLMRV